MFLPQLRIEAYDNGSPSKSDVTIARIVVDRNLQVPVFEEESGEVEVSINYDQPLGVSIATVAATDADTQAPFNVVRYYLIQNDVARRFFAVDLETGDVSVKSDLALDSNDQYEVG